ncbi:MAG: tRNA (N6-threonylcarbamoyladenosine(37)-N6)-methyltransferase TrmO [Anaerovoracaceae bacterium]|jgi:tRNA-Thr(GGU) m(6)t(6)A37 methyltransferase TsaA
MKVIARIHTAFPQKFGIPRQAGLIGGLRARIVFEPGYRDPDAVRGIGGFSHLWLIWGFSKVPEKEFRPLVRPPRLGGEEKVGVFASRSPYRPNSLGLSSVRLIEVAFDENGGPELVVAGADLLDGTPIYDIKPYLAYTDSHPDASGGFTEEKEWPRLRLDFPPQLLAEVDEKLRAPLIQVLELDPRGAYDKGAGQVYGMRFSNYDIRFTVQGDLLRVQEVIDMSQGDHEKVK